ncbi:hypothetical protein D3C87_1623910 [compost metagenome]
MKESAVRIESVSPALLENCIEWVVLPLSASARTVLVVPKSSPSARAMAVLLVVCKND